MKITACITGSLASTSSVIVLPVRVLTKICIVYNSIILLVNTFLNHFVLFYYIIHINNVNPKLHIVDVTIKKIISSNGIVAI